MYFQDKAGFYFSKHSALEPAGGRPARPRTPLARGFTLFWALVTAGLLLLSGQPRAQAQNDAAPSSAQNAVTVASLVYQILVAEFALQSGDVGVSYQVLLGAARKTKNELLFQRSTDIALQAKAGDLALAAAQYWQTAFPESITALRYVTELLVALDRTPQAMPHLRTLLELSSPSARASLINSIPRLLGSTSQASLVAGLLDDVLLPYLRDPPTQMAAHMALARVWMAAGKPDRAMGLIQAAQRLDPRASEPAQAALEFLPTHAQAFDVLERHLQVRADNTPVRLAYVQALAKIQRLSQAMEQLQWMSINQPDNPLGWFLLGTLQLESSHPKEAQRSLKTVLKLLASKPASALSKDTQDGLNSQETTEQMQQKIWLLLSQASDELGDAKEALVWLDKVNDPELDLQVLERRVEIMAKQGKVRQARQLIRELDDTLVSDQAKVVLEALVLRESRQWGQARIVLSMANQRLPNNVDLLYEQAMVEEKLGRLEDMERLLRKIIDLKPDHHHAHNALGYAWAQRNMRLPEAKILIQRALELKPGDPFITDSLAWVEYRLGNTSEALRLLRQAYKFRPDPEIGTHLGEVLWVQGQQEAAKVILREVRQRDPRNEALMETLARLRIKL